MNQTTPFLYLVRGENSGEPESYVFGLYDTFAETKARIKAIKAEGYDYAWYEEVSLGDLDLCNR